MRIKMLEEKLKLPKIWLDEKYNELELIDLKELDQVSDRAYLFYKRNLHNTFDLENYQYGRDN